MMATLTVMTRVMAAFFMMVAVACADVCFDSWDTDSETMDLDSKGLSSVPQCVFNGTYSTMTILYLHNNSITSIPEEIGTLTNLEYLYLYGNQITWIPAEIGNLTNLENLSLHNNQINPFPTEIPIPYFNPTEIRSIPMEIGQLTKLRKLSLENNQIDEIPTEIGQLTNLEYLSLNNNKIKSIPTEIGHLTNLEYLYLYGNQITWISPALIDLMEEENESLIYVISANEPDTPESLCVRNYGLHFVEDDCVEDLCFNSWNADDALMDLIYREWVTPDREYLSSVPECVFDAEYSNMKQLWLDNNQITMIPTEIGQLTKLQYLSFFRNQIKSIPTEIGKLTNLLYLSFNRNQITSIPTEIGNLTNLEYLYLNNNPINKISPALIDLMKEKNESLIYVSSATASEPDTPKSLCVHEYGLRREKNDTCVVDPASLGSGKICIKWTKIQVFDDDDASGDPEYWVKLVGKDNHTLDLGDVRFSCIDSSVRPEFEARENDSSGGIEIVQDLPSASELADLNCEIPAILAECKAQKQNSKYHNGCHTYAYGWEAKTENDCHDCSNTVRDYSKLNFTECSLFCKDLYPEGSNEYSLPLCMSGCNWFDTQITDTGFDTGFFNEKNKKGCQAVKYSGKTANFYLEMYTTCNTGHYGKKCVKCDCENCDEGIDGTGCLLGRCEGDCDYDSDCAGDLKCGQPDNLEENISGCLRQENDADGDYCYQPASVQVMFN